MRLHLSAARRIRLCRDQMWRPVRLLVLELHHLLELVDGLAVAQPRGGRPWCASLQRAVCVHVLGWGVRQSDLRRSVVRPPMFTAASNSTPRVEPLETRRGEGARSTSQEQP